MVADERTPGAKLGMAIVIALLLSLPLFAVWLLVYDRQQQSVHAQTGIAEGWGGPQIIAGPLLAIPYRATSTETATENGKPVTRTVESWKEMILSPEAVELDTAVDPERRRRSIYEVVVYDAQVRGRARFALPADLARYGVALADLALNHAELRFGISDPRGLGANPRVRAAGRPLRLQPGGGTQATGDAGFFAWFDASALGQGPVPVEFAYEIRGNGGLSLAPDAGETVWRVRSAWPHPSFQGGFLPAEREVSGDGFSAVYRVGSLALGRSLVSGTPTGSRTAAAPPPTEARSYDGSVPALEAPAMAAQIGLVQPVDLYAQVNRATKYGFLFIGFTFLAFFLFDVIGGVRVSSIEYLLVGAALILFFVLLLAFAEVIGFTPAYLVASGAIVGLNTAYSAAVLGSWRRAGFIAALLAGLYVTLYVLLSLEAFSLLIGSLLLFAALAAIMYLTRGIDWGASRAEPAPAAA